MSNAADYPHGARRDWDRPQWPRAGFHPLWIGVMVLGFILWWPIGLAILFYTLWSRSMCRHANGRWDEKFDRFRSRMSEGFRGFDGPSSGNRAFDEYRSETLKRLEDEQREFKDFLYRLRHAKDKAEFDQFMDQRRNNPPAAPAAPSGEVRPNQ